MGSIKTETVVSFVEAGVKDIFVGLQDFRSLTRERALEAFRSGLDEARFEQCAVEAAVLEALCSDSWEAKQGGLLAATEAVKEWDAPDFRDKLLAAVPRLLTDTEYRVRKAVAPVVEECCRRDGLEVFDRLADVVMGDIGDKFKRTAEEPEGDPDAPSAPPSFLPDTEGWRSLETSMGALQSMMQGCGSAFTPRITEEMLALIEQCSKHTNRFVREYAYFALKNAYEVCSQDVFLEFVGPKSVLVVKAGIRDNWSQVRFAASVACRAFMSKAGDEKSRFFPELLGNMCLNRHYVAEGVRLYSQDTWKEVCGPQGGARLLVGHFDEVIASYVDAAKAPNHAVREAACNCISELASRVAGLPDAPTAYRQEFTAARVQRLLQALLVAFQDESWPVRDVASLALGHFVRAFPKESEPFRGQMVDLWFGQMADNIPSMRKNGAVAMAMAVKTWTDELWPEVLEQLRETLPSVVDQTENSETFSQYSPSGPFSVAKPKPTALEDKPDPAFSDQTMYSCGSGAPKTFKRKDRRKDAGGCMNCANEMPRQLWEASEGMVHLLAELALQAAEASFGSKEDRLDELASLLPSLAIAVECSHYRHHHLFKQRVCERLLDISGSLGQTRMADHRERLLKTLVECQRQDAHASLQQLADNVVRAWQSPS